jgi:hypothetical protein
MSSSWNRLLEKDISRPCNFWRFCVVDLKCSLSITRQLMLVRLWQPFLSRKLSSQGSEVKSKETSKSWIAPTDPGDAVVWHRLDLSQIRIIHPPVSRNFYDLWSNKRRTSLSLLPIPAFMNLGLIQLCISGSDLMMRPLWASRAYHSFILSLRLVIYEVLRLCNNFIFIDSGCMNALNFCETTATDTYDYLELERKLFKVSISNAVHCTKMQYHWEVNRINGRLAGGIGLFRRIDILEEQTRDLVSVITFSIWCTTGLKGGGSIVILFLVRAGDHHFLDVGCTYDLW